MTPSTSVSNSLSAIKYGSSPWTSQLNDPQRSWIGNALVPLRLSNELALKYTDCNSPHPWKFTLCFMSRSSNLIISLRSLIALVLRRLLSSSNLNWSMKWKKFWILSIVTSACSISLNGKATIHATIPGNPSHLLKIHLISSKRFMRNIHVVLSLRSPCNVLPVTIVDSCLRLSSSMFYVSSVVLSSCTLVFFSFFSSETSLSRRGGIVRT